MPTNFPSRIRLATLAIAAVIGCTGVVRAADRPMIEPALAVAEAGQGSRRGPRPVNVRPAAPFEARMVVLEPVQTTRGTRMRPVTEANGAAASTTRLAVMRPVQTARGTRMRPDLTAGFELAALTTLR